MTVIRWNMDLSSYEYIIIWCILNIALWFLVVVAFGFSCSRNQMHFWRAAVTVRFPLYSKIPHEIREKEHCSQKVPYIKKDMLGYVIAYGSRSRRDIFDISQCSQTKLTKTPKTYTLILKTSEVILASSLILIVFIHPYFLWEHLEEWARRLGGQQCLGYHILLEVTWNIYYDAL